MPKKPKTPSLTLRDLSTTSFSADVLTNAFNVGVELGDATPVRVEASDSRDPDEHEFYLLRVGHALAQVFALCEQLADIPAYIKHARVTKALRSAGIHRHDLLVYHLENYFVRCQGLYDRTLTLVDAVFHLLNAPTQKERLCRARQRKGRTYGCPEARQGAWQTVATLPDGTKRSCPSANAPD
ncbi:hypothetical protein ACFQ3P_14455 [Paraburkholderia sabiae]|uniref:Uncharacterized protein n=1 Tax=Paraburkholderia sabiae TaxID=273251 RepID=A0ABU9Q8B8_9BURK|nr:hypothetical protein [Paraburkholderia sabiae]WJZ77706.1 hypothetical protein QEN71_37310 [Paraburkholderia sabiae]